MQHGYLYRYIYIQISIDICMSIDIHIPEQNIPFAPIFRHIRTRCAFVDTFEFATNKAFDVCVGMSLLF